MGKLMKRKWLAVGIILLFVGTCTIPAIAQNTEKTLLASRGNWLYVGGNGPGNYTRIQDAIDNASDGDTVFVYSGVYYKRLVVSDAIYLLGESKNTTIIDATTSDNGIMILIASNNIIISGFTLRYNGDDCAYHVIILNKYPINSDNLTVMGNIFYATGSTAMALVKFDCCHIIDNTFILRDSSRGISIGDGKNCVVWNNTLSGHHSGIDLSNIQNVTLRNNIIIDCLCAVELAHIVNMTISNNTLINISERTLRLIECDNTTITFNVITNGDKGIVLRETNGCYITRNIFHKSQMGIFVEQSRDFSITRNFFTKCKFGVFIDNSYSGAVLQNTFEKNLVHARFNYDDKTYNTLWDQNYWGRPRIFPKPIFGIKDIFSPYPGFFEFDRHPAQQPYDILEKS